MLLNLIKHQRFDVDKICHSIQIKVWITINKREKVGIEKLKNPKAFIDYSQTIDNVYESFEDYNATKKKKVVIVFDYLLADMESDEKLSLIVAEFF